MDRSRAISVIFLRLIYQTAISNDQKLHVSSFNNYIKLILLDFISIKSKSGTISFSLFHKIFPSRLFFFSRCWKLGCSVYIILMWRHIIVDVISRNMSPRINVIVYIYSSYLAIISSISSFLSLEYAHTNVTREYKSDNNVPRRTRFHVSPPLKIFEHSAD